MQLFAGLYLPLTTAIIGGVYLIGRSLFSYGYVAGGPKGRMIGAPIVMMVQGLMPIYTIVVMALMANDIKKVKLDTGAASA